MRLIKTLGLMAICAIAAAALLGVTSASAVSLCKSSHPLDECPVTERYGIPTTLQASLVAGTHLTILSNLGNILCKKSEIEGKTTSQTEESLLGEFTKFTLGECTLGGTACTVTTPTPFVWHILLAVETVNEPVDLGGGSYQQHYHLVLLNSKFVFKCGFAVNCTFGAPEILFNIRDLAEDIDLLTLQALNREGGICPSTSTWHAQYLVTSPNPVHIAMKP